MPLLKITSSFEGFGDFEKSTDLNIVQIQVNKKIPLALERVGAEMQASLTKHLWNDWYSMYTPKEYLRRTDHPSLGTSILHANTMDIHVNGNSLEFTYTPIGEYPEAPEWHTNDGDRLIESIQTGKLWGNPPPRPFWNNFVNEMAHGDIVNALADALPYKIEGLPKTINLNSYLLDASTYEELPF